MLPSGKSRQISEVSGYRFKVHFKQQTDEKYANEQLCVTGLHRHSSAPRTAVNLFLTRSSTPTPTPTAALSSGGAARNTRETCTESRQG